MGVGVHEMYSTRLVLTNTTIYFKGNREHPFDNPATQEAPFATSAGEKVKVPLMFNRSGS